MLKKILPVSIVSLMVIAAIISTGCLKKRILCSTPEQRGQFMVDRISSKLDLTKEQVVKLNKIKDEIVARIKTYQSDREAVQKEMIELIKSDKLDRNKLENFINKGEAKMKDMKPLIIEKIAEFHDMLTPEQRAKIVEKMDKFYHYCD